jgi:hypothetical protein
MSLFERWRIARRWSSLQMPSLLSASFHEMRTTSCMRRTASPHVFGGSVNSEMCAGLRWVYHTPRAAAAAPAAAMLAIARDRTAGRRDAGRAEMLASEARGPSSSRSKKRADEDETRA